MENESRLFYGMIRDFLTVYLPKQKGASFNTIKSYRDTLNIFLEYLRDAMSMPLDRLSFQCINQRHVENFLDWLEERRCYGISSRNQRLSGLRSFCRYAAGRDKTLMSLYLELSDIPKKRQPAVYTEYFSESALKSILAQPDTHKKKGDRDLVFMILLYDTGVRIQEILDIQLQDVHLSGESSYVLVTGKGGKTRVVPIMAKTSEHLLGYLARFHPSPLGTDFLFYTERKGERTAMSPDNAEKFIAIYGTKARLETPRFLSIFTRICSVTRGRCTFIRTGCLCHYLQNGLGMHR
jgi:site-specific recombinase XerD